MVEIGIFKIRFFISPILDRFEIRVVCKELCITSVISEHVPKDQLEGYILQTIEYSVEQLAKKIYQHSKFYIFIRNGFYNEIQNPFILEKIFTSKEVSFFKKHIK